VTCLVEPAGVFFWLTRESGKLAVCRKAPACGCGRTEERSLPVRRSVVAVKAVGQVGGCFYSGVAVAPLSSETLKVAVDRVSVDLVRGVSFDTADVNAVRKKLYVLRAYMKELQYGMYHSGAGCSCVPGSVCSQCVSRMPEQWFCAVDWRWSASAVVMAGPAIFGTDTVGAVSMCDGHERRWLSCVGEDTFCALCKGIGLEEEWQDSLRWFFPREEDVPLWEREPQSG
jgi:hypothetical protein